MASITYTQAKELVDSFNSGVYCAINGKSNFGITLLTPLVKGEKKTVALIHAGIDFQVWGIRSIDIIGKHLTIYGEGAPVDIPIRG